MVLSSRMMDPTCDLCLAQCPLDLFLGGPDIKESSWWRVDRLGRGKVSLFGAIAV